VSKVDDGGSAIPTVVITCDYAPDADGITRLVSSVVAPHRGSGLSLRDIFAAQFAMGLANHAHWMSEPGMNEQNARLAATAYGLADAMLAARKPAKEAE
jgi:hypothetical protein